MELSFEENKSVERCYTTIYEVLLILLSIFETIQSNIRQ